MKPPRHLKVIDREADKISVSRLGERLLALGLVSDDQLQIALHEQKNGNRLLGTLLVELGFLDDNKLADVLADRSGYRSLDLKNAELEPQLIRSLPKDVAERCRAVPVALDGSVLELAMADPHDIRAIDEVRRHIDPAYSLRPVVASASDIAAVLDRYGELASTLNDILRELEDGDGIKRKHDADWQHPIVRLANTILLDAVRSDASDIHLEPESNFIRVRYRIDGIMRQVRALHRTHWPALSHRLKLMAGMNIADTRSLQDGRFQLDAGGVPIDFRMAVMPVVHGENIVIRILDSRRAQVSLTQLGYADTARDTLDTILDRPEGIVFVTGPTGCGKTTTLYAMLHQISSVDVNIMTLEEPVEYQLSLIRQTSVQAQQGLTFGEGVRGILRQDPDIIFIGEVRDTDTAQMALRAAMTGHQVFSTLHCNDAIGALPRLHDLGLTSAMIAGNIAGIIAQRLTRKLCPHCKQPRAATTDEMNLIRQHMQPVLESLALPAAVDGFAEAQTPYVMDAEIVEAETLLYEPKGCKACDDTGYRGRIAVAEILRVTPALDDLIAEGAPRSHLLKQARADGMMPLAAAGLHKVLDGVINLDGLRHVVDLTRPY